LREEINVGSRDGIQVNSSADSQTRAEYRDKLDNSSDIQKVTYFSDGKTLNCLLVPWPNQKKISFSHGAVMQLETEKPCLGHNNGTTFSEEINLSNSSSSDSINAQVMASRNNVFVTWWETNQTEDTPVLRVSNDNGETFGPLLKLATNDILETGKGNIQY
jgi:hypothetical protein